MSNTEGVKKKTKKSSTVTTTVLVESKKGAELSTEKKFQYLYNRIQTGKKVDGQGYNYMKNEYVQTVFKHVTDEKLRHLDSVLKDLSKFIYDTEGVIYNIEHPETDKRIQELQAENAKLKEQLEKATKKTTKKSTVKATTTK